MLGVIEESVFVSGWYILKLGILIWQGFASLDSNSLATIIGAITGAIIAGGIGFLVQKRANQFAKEQKEIEKSENNKALGYSLFFKFAKIQAGLITAEKHIKECKKKIPEAHKENMQLWQVITPLAVRQREIYFSSEEITLLASLKQIALLNEILMLDHSYNSDFELFRVYGVERALLNSMLSSEMIDGQGQAKFDPAKFVTAGPKIFEVNNLAVQLDRQISEDVEKVEKASDQLAIILKQELGIPLKVETVNK